MFVRVCVPLQELVCLCGDTHHQLCDGGWGGDVCQARIPALCLGSVFQGDDVSNPLPPCLPPSLPPSLCPSLPPSLPTNFPSSRPPSLPPSLCIVYELVGTWFPPTVWQLLLHKKKKNIRGFFFHFCGWFRSESVPALFFSRSRQVGSWKLKSLLGQGKFDHVWAGWQTVL